MSPAFVVSLLPLLFSLQIAAVPTIGPLPAKLTTVQATAQTFLDLFNGIYQRLTTVDNENSWAASTDVNDRNDGRRTASGQMAAAFLGNQTVIADTRKWLSQKAKLTPLQVRQLEAILFKAASAPGTIPQVVDARIEAESQQASLQDGYVYCLALRGPDGKCPKPATANDIDAVLRTSTDLPERLNVWNASKELGRPLKAGLVTLQKLRNQLAREMGFSSFFALQVSEYGMSVDEMRKLTQGFITDTKPLYKALHTWTRRQLAAKYGQPEPKDAIPAHWLTNRWAQNWVALAPGVDLDPYFKDKTPEWIVKQAEKFYVSMGFAPLPASFWTKSDLYPVPPGENRKKNSHASAWHMDLNKDVRSLMSVESNSEWFSTAHHELGHIFYFLSYSRPGVPPLLRDGANRAFHEGMGELISIAAGQVPYLQQQKILPPDVKIDQTAFLLNEALEHTISFIPWSAGVMTEFEYQLYEKNLPPEKWQETWWKLVAEYQDVAPPDMARLTDPTACDACTKTHINDDPAQYYDYAIATVLKYQLNEYIATKILKQDPHSCNYYGNKEVGKFLKKIMEQGATRDWRLVLKEATGEDLSTRAMVAYFKPLQVWLDAENAKAAAK